MKKWHRLIMVVVMLVLVFGATTDISSTKYRERMIYYHNTTDFNDCNTADLTNTASFTLIYTSFYGSLSDAIFDMAGTDTSFAVKYFIDPPELGGETEVHKLYEIFDVNLTTVNDYNVVVITQGDKAGNPYGGPPYCGDLYIGLVGTTWHADGNDANNLTDLRIYTNVRVEKQ